jgi:hypothetical protein
VLDNDHRQGRRDTVGCQSIPRPSQCCP